MRKGTVLAVLVAGVSVVLVATSVMAVPPLGVEFTVVTNLPVVGSAPFVATGSAVMTAAEHSIWSYACGSTPPRATRRAFGRSLGEPGTTLFSKGAGSSLGHTMLSPAPSRMSIVGNYGSLLRSPPNPTAAAVVETWDVPYLARRLVGDQRQIKMTRLAGGVSCRSPFVFTSRRPAWQSLFSISAKSEFSEERLPQ